MLDRKLGSTGLSSEVSQVFIMTLSDVDRQPAGDGMFMLGVAGVH